MMSKIAFSQPDYEKEFKRLESMYIELDQIRKLLQFAETKNQLELLQLLEILEYITKRGISFMLKYLFEAGCGQELKRRGLVS